MEINDRISQLISKLSLNPNSFADAIGVKSTVIYNIVKGRRSKPSFDVLQKIFFAYEALNANWLLNGDGAVWNQEIKSEEIEPAYLRLEKRIKELIVSIRTIAGDIPEVDEIEELITNLLEENVEQKFKIISLYEKQDQILDVIRKKLSIDI